MAIALLGIPALASGQLSTVRRVVGDTTVVRTVGTEPASATRTLTRVFSFGKFDGAPEYVFGRISAVRLAPDGSVWVFDMSVPALRHFDSTGKFIRQVGRGGSGPGEYGELLALAMPPRGGVVIFDPRNGHLNLFNGAGLFTTSWTVATGRSGRGQPRTAFVGVGGVETDRSGTIYVRSTVTGSPVLIALDASGRARDTLSPPSLRLPPPSPSGLAALSAYLPREYWTFSRLGYFVGGRSDIYAIHLITGSRVIRIERDVPAIVIDAAERQRISAPTSARGAGQATVSASDVPRAKPFFGGITTDEDGRIWVRMRTQPQRMLDTVDASRGRGGELIPASVHERFDEPTVFEVFAADGRYLGRVRLPDFIYPPSIKGDAVWAATVDADGVPVVTKYRIVPSLGR
jgi:hypothetical protein